MTIRTYQDYRTLLADNPAAGVGYALAAHAVLAGRLKRIDIEDNSLAEAWAIEKRRLRAAYGETLTARQVLVEMDSPGITADAAAGAKFWGRSPLPQGGLLVGTVGCGALIWLPTGWWSGGGGVLKRLPARETQRDWLQSVRGAQGGWERLPVEVSRRTWENWEQGRPIPPAQAYAIWQALQAAGGGGGP